MDHHVLPYSESLHQDQCVMCMKISFLSFLIEPVHDVRYRVTQQVPFMRMENHQREKECQNAEYKYEYNHSCLIFSREVCGEIHERYLRYFATGDNNLPCLVETIGDACKRSGVMAILNGRNNRTQQMTSIDVDSRHQECQNEGEHEEQRKNDDRLVLCVMCMRFSLNMTVLDVVTVRDIWCKSGQDVMTVQDIRRKGRQSAHCHQYSEHTTSEDEKETKDEYPSFSENCGVHEVLLKYDR